MNDDITNITEEITQQIERSLSSYEEVAQPFEQETLDVMDVLESGSGFNRSFETTIADLSGVFLDVNQAVAGVGSVINAVDPSIVAKVTAVTNTLSSVIANVQSFASHVGDVFDSIPDRLATFSSSQGLRNALEKNSQSCDTMHDFFGSITHNGPKIIGEMTGNINTLLQTVNDFKALTVELQTVVATTQSQIESVLNTQITLTADPNRITQLTNILTAIQNDFGSGTGAERDTIVRDLRNILSPSVMTQINGIAGPMRNLDFDILGKANRAEIEAGDLTAKSSSIQDIISGESSIMQQAEQKLLQFARASSIRSLFKGDPCVNTLLGYIGTDDLLKKLF